MQFWSSLSQTEGTRKRMVRNSRATKTSMITNGNSSSLKGNKKRHDKDMTNEQPGEIKDPTISNTRKAG